VVNNRPSDYQDFCSDEISYASQGSPNQITFGTHPVSSALKNYQLKKAHRIEKVSKKL
jgi:hypothetical protein